MVIEVQCSGVPEVLCWVVFVVVVVEYEVCCVWVVIMGAVCFVVIGMFVAGLGVCYVGVGIVRSQSVVMTVQVLVVRG